MAQRMKNGSKMESFRQGHLYWYDPGETTGSEIKKIRPCLILTSDTISRFMDVVTVVPLTSSQKLWPTRVHFKHVGRDSYIACDQIRSTDKSRMLGYIRELPIDVYKEVTKTLDDNFSLNKAEK